MRKTIKSRTNIDLIVGNQLNRSKFRKVRRVPRMILPKSIAARYARELRKLINKQIAIVNSMLIPHLPSLVADAGYLSPVKYDSTRLDAWAEEAERLLDAMDISLTGTLTDFEYVAADIGQKVNSWQNAQWRKVMRSAVGVELYGDERWLNDALKSFTNENTALITKLTSDTRSDIQRVVLSDIRQGKRAKTISKEILGGTDLQKGIFRKVKTRADLIAVDQTLKFYGQLNELRQKSIGLTRYKWRNSQDERVRGNPNGKFPNSQYDHWTREGKTFLFDKSPPDGNPGQPIRCRCYAEPIFEDLLLDEEE